MHFSLGPGACFSDVKIGMLCGAFPPELDGIGDYTWWLSRELVAAGEDVTIFTSTGIERHALTGAKVVAFFDRKEPASINALSQLLKPEIGLAKFDWLIVQYNPFSFGRRGYCPWVPAVLREIKRRKLARIAVMFHETMVPSWPCRFAVMRLWQYPIFRAICRMADVAFVSAGRWRPQVTKANGRVRCHVLPVGSNIPLSNLSRTEARRNLKLPLDALILGLFGQAHPSRLLGWVDAAAHSVISSERTVKLVYVGPHGSEVRVACSRVDLIDAQTQPAAAVGIYMRSMDAMICPFIDGVSTRRGSIMTPMQHGIPVATTVSKWTDPIFHAAPGLLLAPVSSPSNFGQAFKEWLFRCPPQATLGPALMHFYEQNFSWPVIAKIMRSGLKETDRS